MLVAIPNVYANFCQLLQKKLVLAFFFRISSPHYNLRTSVVLLPDERPNESCRKFVSLAFFFFFRQKVKISRSTEIVNFDELFL